MSPWRKRRPDARDGSRSTIRSPRRAMVVGAVRARGTRPRLARVRRGRAYAPAFAMSDTRRATATLQRLSVARSRRIALAAQGFGRPRPARPPNMGQISALVARLGAL